MAQTNDSKLLEKVLSKTNDEIIKRIMERYVETPIHSVNLHTRLNWIINQARLAERAKCIAQLKDHQAHCDNCAKDNIEMAIIILEKNEAIE